MSVRVQRKSPDAAKELLKRFQQLAKKEIAVGFPKGMTEAYPEGQTVIQVAAENCYGTPTIPERNFMAYAASDIQKRTKPLMKLIAKIGGSVRLSSTDAKKLDVFQNAAGLAAQAAIKQAIVDLDTPPNAPATIAAKKSSNPLIDTGKMHDAVTYVIRDRTRKPKK